MVVAPDGVLAYMCHNFDLHNTAVFQKSNEDYSSLIEDMGIKNFFYCASSSSATTQDPTPGTTSAPTSTPTSTPMSTPTSATMSTPTSNQTNPDPNPPVFKCMICKAPFSSHVDMMSHRIIHPIKEKGNGLSVDDESPEDSIYDQIKNRSKLHYIFFGCSHKDYH